MEKPRGTTHTMINHQRTMKKISSDRRFGPHQSTATTNRKIDSFPPTNLRIFCREITYDSMDPRIRIAGRYPNRTWILWSTRYSSAWRNPNYLTQPRKCNIWFGCSTTHKVPHRPFISGLGFSTPWISPSHSFSPPFIFLTLSSTSISPLLYLFLFSSSRQGKVSI